MDTFAGLGTRMRHLLELLDGDVARVYADLGITGYRPRFSPVIRAIVARGPLSIRDLARAVGVTHSAASQTAAQMTRAGLLTLEPGADSRQRIASLTVRARGLLPLIEAEWAATDLAAAELEAELPAALTEILFLAERAVLARSMHSRIRAAAQTLHAALAPGTHPAGTHPAGTHPADSDPAGTHPAGGWRAAHRAALLAIAGQAPLTGDAAVTDDAG